MPQRTLSKLFCVFQNGIFREKWTFQTYFSYRFRKISCFFSDKVKCWLQSSTIQAKNTEISLCNKSKMLQFSRIKKMCCFKRATFCIIQRKVKLRYILLIQIFIFLLRCLLNLVKVHIMLCTFKNGTIKSLILTLNMFKRFFFSFLFDMVSRTVMQTSAQV